MIGVTGVILLFVFAADAQLNPLGRFGKCIDVPVCDYDESYDGTWYLQYRNDNPDHYVHTCQAQYEQVVKGDLISLLYFYNKGVMVNAPQKIPYQILQHGKYKRGITTDGEAVYVYFNVLHFDPVKNYRVVYYCTDNPKANPDIFNINIATEEPNPNNVEEVLAESKAKLKAISPRFDVPLMKTEQSLKHCAPLNIKKKKKRD